MGPEGMQILAASPHLQALRQLDYAEAELGGESGAVLRRLLERTSLTKLSLGANSLDGHSMRAFGHAGASSLQDLGLERNPIGASGAESLMAAELTALKTLNLSGCSLSSAGAVAVASARLPSIERLWLDNNALADAGAKALLNAPWRRSVRCLGLSNNMLSEPALREVLLADSDGWSALRELRIGEFELSPETQREVRERYGRRLNLIRVPYRSAWFRR